MSDAAARRAIVAAYRAGDAPRAEQACRALLQSAPRDRLALQVLGAIAYQRGDWRRAAEWLGRAVREAPQDAAMRFNYAEALREASDTTAAIGELRATVKLARNHVPALVTLGRLLGESGDAAAGLSLLERAAALAPHDPKVFLVRGTLRFRAGAAGAVEDLTRAAELDPELALAQFYLGLAAAQGGDLARADAAFARVIALDPASAAAYAERGKVASLRKDPAAAEKYYRLALARDASASTTHALLAETLTDLRRYDDAAAAVAQARAGDGDNPFARLIDAKIARRTGRPDAARALLEPLLAAPADPHIGVDGAYELGHALDALGRPDDAFRWFATGNAAIARSPAALAADRALLPARIAAMAALAPPGPRAAAAGERPPPHFIVGFPRSGTTLVEAILASHPAFVTSDEAPLVSRLIRDLENYPQMLESVSETDLDDLRAAYWRHAESALPGLTPQVRLIDKQPLNLIELPLIARLFPRARIVTVLRDPRDVCLSCFQQYFVLNAGNVHFLSLDDTAALYAQVMGLWQRLSAAGWLTSHTLRYEDVVGDFDGAIGRLLDFLGVAWDDAVRAFPQSAAGRVITTPSRDAVSRELYAGAVGKWRRYESHLAANLPTLAPFVAAFGYGEG